MGGAVVGDVCGVGFVGEVGGFSCGVQAIMHDVNNKNNPFIKSRPQNKIHRHLGV